MRFWICLFMIGMTMVAPGIESLRAQSPQTDTAAWLDSKVPAKEREVLNRSLGAAPPDGVAGFRWIGEEPRYWASYRGRVVVLQTWTSTSELGRTIVSRAVAALTDLPSDQYVIVALHTPTNASSAERFAESFPSSVQLAVDEKGNWCDQMGIFRRPVTILIDRNGAVRAAGVQTEALPDAVRALASEPFDDKASPPQVVPPRDAPSGASSKIEFPKKQTVERANDLWGKKGPPLKVQTYVNGSPQTNGKVVIAEFWATWCPPCRESIPHMNKLSSKFKDDVVCVGISDEPIGTIRQFMDKTKFSYTVASDPGKTMAKVIGHEGIPYAIVMSPDGIVRWQGHPMTLSNRVLSDIVLASKAKGPASAGDAPRWVTPAKK